MQGQAVSRDSIDNLNKNVAKSEAEKQLNVKKLKLASMENSLAGKRKNMEDCQREAQESANYNAEIANKLSSDPDNRRLARKSRKAAKASEKKARASRSATQDYNDLQHQIEDARKKIQESEEKLKQL